MSFILDAVKKSEQERRYSQVDTAQSWYYQPPKPKPKKQYWVAALVLVNTLVLLGLLLWVAKPSWLDVSISFGTGSEAESNVASMTAPEQDTISVSASKSSAEPESQTSAIQAPVSVPDPIVTIPEAVVEPVNEVITPSIGFSGSDTTAQGEPRALNDIPDLEALPESVLIHIPAIAFSSHLYSSEPTARQVVVNGQKLREADYLNRDLQLLEIQEKHVIFQQFQSPFKVLLSRYWVRSE